MFQSIYTLIDQIHACKVNDQVITNALDLLSMFNDQDVLPIQIIYDSSSVKHNNVIFVWIKDSKLITFLKVYSIPCIEYYKCISDKSNKKHKLLKEQVSLQKSASIRSVLNEINVMCS
jgi:hypothetical protein